jgi:ribosome-binding factor A
MRESEIKRKRTESLLKELIPEALSTLDDSRVNSLSITEVVCSRGRYDAKVFIDKSGIEESEQKEILLRLKKLSNYLKTYIRDSEGWYKAPNFIFEFDDEIERIAKMDRLFEQIGREKRDGGAYK